MFRRLALTFGSNVLSLGITMVTSILTARVLGPAGRGELAAIILWASVLTALGGFGLTEATVFYSGKLPNALRTVCANAVLLALALSAFLVPLGWWIVPHVLRAYPPPAIAAARLLLLFIPVYFLGLLLIAMLQGRLHMRAFNLLRLSVSVLYLVGLLVVWRLGMLTSRSAALCLLVAASATALVAWFMVARAGWFGLRPDFSLMRAMFRYGVKVHFGNMSGVLNARLDQMLISIFLAPAQLGIYAVATTLAGLLQIVSSAFEMVAFPSLVERSEDAARRLALGRFFRMNLLCLLAAMLGLLLLTPLAVRLAFGAPFAAAVPISRILLVGALFTGCVAIVNSGFKAFNEPFTVTAGQVAGLVATGLALALLLPRLQLTGAALAIVLGTFCNLATMLFFAQRRLHVSVRELLRVEAADVNAFAALGSRLKARAAAAVVEAPIP